MVYDLAIAWNWEYDKGFVSGLHNKALIENVSIFEINGQNVENLLELLKKDEIRFKYFLDRASDEDDRLQPLVRFIVDQYHPADAASISPINLPDLQLHAADKATMHLEFLAHNIDVPYTIIISPFSDKKEVEISLSELAKLGRPFIIKPANNTGGGLGVVMGAETLKEIIEARQFNKRDKYLLQETIKPLMFDGKRGWFRVFYAFGDIIPCWWDDITHVYAPLSEHEELQFGLGKLRTVTAGIYDICRLEFFSTELAYISGGKCVAVDYVNEMCDMRLQSQFSDGVPDIIVERIISGLIEHVKRGRSESNHMNSL